MTCERLFHLRPVLNAVRNRLLQFEVEVIVSIDMQMIPFKGRFIVKQYVKDRPIRWGLKVFVL